MALHDELIALARQMVDRNPGAPIEAELRRAVSTAYYALFHLLIFEGTTRLVLSPDLRARVARTYDHGMMTKVCREFNDIKKNFADQYIHSSGVLIPPAVLAVGKAFVDLQDARIKADYNTGTPMTYLEAELLVGTAELAFDEWLPINADPGASVFLAELWCKGIPKRN